MAEPNPYIDVLRLVAAGIVGGLIATYSNHLLTVGREKRSGQKTRKREFLAFMQQWKHEIDRWHFVTGGRERRQMAFYDGVSAFCVMAEPIRNDFSGSQKDRFIELFNTITKHGKLDYGYKHEDLIKTIDELITIAEN